MRKHLRTSGLSSSPVSGCVRNTSSRLISSSISSSIASGLFLRNSLMTTSFSSGSTVQVL